MSLAGPNIAVVLLVIAAVVLIVLSPFALVWALNTLFTLNIPFTFQTYLAALILEAVLAAKSSSN